MEKERRRREEKRNRMRAYKYVNWVRERKRSRSGVKNATTSHDVSTHMYVASPGPTFVHVIELFLILLLLGRQGVPLRTSWRRGGEWGRGRKVEMRKLPQTGK